MPIDENILEQLLHEEEGSALDFKGGQYPFEGQDDKPKSELLKDILAFANARRRATAYILIGVDEVRGGRSKIVGVKKHLDDAKLHQFVNSKTQRPIEFSYQPFHTENMEIGVIEVPIQERPFYLKKKFGNLNSNVIYKRDGSSTAIATLDEIARMGAEQDFSGTPQLILEWANIKRRVVLPSPHTVNSLFLNPRLSDDTFEEPHSVYSSPIDNAHDNKNYSREIILYTCQMAFLKSFGLRLLNDSGVVGKRVRFVGSVAKDNAFSVLDNQPERPYRKTMDKITDLMVQQHLAIPIPAYESLLTGGKLLLSSAMFALAKKSGRPAHCSLGQETGSQDWRASYRATTYQSPLLAYSKSALRSSKGQWRGRTSNHTWIVGEKVMMTRQWTAIIGREDDGYVALCPELDIASQGVTVTEARENLKEALELFFETASATEIEHRLHEEMY